MRALPTHIYDNRDAWLVRIKRGEVKFSAVVMKSRPDALAQAIALRDRFYELHGLHTERAAKSNTGLTGITDVTKWWHSRPYDCFQVTAGHPRNRKMRRFFYRRPADRLPALRAAIAYRAQLTGQTPEQITHGQPLENFCLS